MKITFGMIKSGVPFLINSDESDEGVVFIKTEPFSIDGFEYNSMLVELNKNYRSSTIFHYFPSSTRVFPVALRPIK